MASVRGGYLGQGDVQLGDKSVQLSLYKSSACITTSTSVLLTDNEFVGSAMNISGPPIAAVCRRMVHCAPNEMLVLQDSLSHRPQVLEFTPISNALCLLTRLSRLFPCDWVGLRMVTMV